MIIFETFTLLIHLAGTTHNVFMYIVGDKSRHRLLFYIQFSVYMVVYNARQEEVSKRRRNHVKALLYEPLVTNLLLKPLYFT